MALNYQAAVEINANFKGQNEVEKASKSFKSVGDAAEVAGSKLKTFGAAAGVAILAYLAKETVQASKALIDLGDEFNDLRQKTGIGVQALSNLKTAAELNGVEFENLQGALKKFSVITAGASAGVKSSAAGFDALGISVKDSQGNLKTSDKLLFEVADKFEQMQDGAGKAAVAVKLFGKQGADLIPLLNQGSEEIQRSGLRLGDDFARNSDQFNDSVSLIALNFKQFGIDLLNPVLPALNAVGEALIDVTGSTGESSGATLILSETIKALGITAIAVFETIKTAIDLLVVQNLNLAIEIVKGLASELVNLSNVTTGFIQALSGDLGAAQQSLLKFYENVGNGYKGMVVNVSKDGADFINRLKSSIETTSKAFDTIYKKNPSNSPARKSGGFSPDLSSLNDSEAEKAADKYKREAEAVGKLGLELNQLSELRALEANRTSMSTKEYEKNVQAIKDKYDMEKATVGWSDKTREAYRNVSQAIRDQKTAIKELQEQQKQSFGYGAQQAMEEYVANAKDSARQTKDLFTAAFKGLEDAIVNFVKTGKLSFADLASSISEMLIRIAVQKAIVFGIESLGGLFTGGATTVSSTATATSLNSAPTFYAANGGIVGPDGPVPLKTYARGGIADSPQLAVFGEGSMSEAYVPLPDGRSIPVTMKGAGGGSNNVTVNVNVSGGSSTDEGTTSDTDKGRELGKLISNAITAALIKEQRPGGLLAARA